MKADFNSNTSESREGTSGRGIGEGVTFAERMAVNGIVSASQKDVSPNLINEFKCINGKKSGLVNFKNNHVKVSLFRVIDQLLISLMF